MNQQNAKEYLPLVQALADGELQIQDEEGGWRDITTTCLSMPFHHYRRRPKPEMVPLEPEDVPPGTMLRHKETTLWMLITAVCPTRVGFSDCYGKFNQADFEKLRDGYEISCDGGKTWKKCEKEKRA